LLQSHGRGDEMRNDRGITLIELLATLTITTLVLGVGFILFSSYYGLFNNSMQKSSDNISINSVIDTISRELADPVSMYYQDNGSTVELRYQTFDNHFRAFIYEKASNSLSLAQLSNTDLASPSYMTPYKNLANNLKFDASNTGSAFYVNEATNTSVLPSGSITSSLINIWIKLELTTITSNGRSTKTYQPYNINVFKSNS
jgi:type II secretory pathway pseudopilin PulG